MTSLPNRASAFAASRTVRPTVAREVRWDPMQRSRLRLAAEEEGYRSRESFGAIPEESLPSQKRLVPTDLEVDAMVGELHGRKLSRPNLRVLEFHDEAGTQSAVTLDAVDDLPPPSEPPLSRTTLRLWDFGSPSSAVTR